MYETSISSDIQQQGGFLGFHFLLPYCWNCLASHLLQNQGFGQVETCINPYCQQINPDAEQDQISVLIFQKHVSLLLMALRIAYRHSLFKM